MNDFEQSVEEEGPVLLAGNNPFDLARRVRHKMNCCCNSHRADEDITYLWLYVDRRGATTPPPSGPTPRLEDWLNVIDEAAAAGVRYLVISLESGFGAFPHLWEICKWAQEQHGMTVGLHTLATELTAEECELIRQLTLDRTRLLVCKDGITRFKHLEDGGVKLRLGQLEESNPMGSCDKPGRMVYINAHGVLYTCGMVDGDDNYRLGTIFEGEFKNILRDPALPHRIDQQQHYHERGCDGCPPLFEHCLAGD